MSPAVAEESLADILERLGNIPAQRVRIPPAPGLATEDDLLAALKQPHKRICELIDGVLVEKAMGFRESRLMLLLGGLLNAFVIPRNLGIVSGADGMMRLIPGRVRIPDIAFASWSRFPNPDAATESVPDLVPDLAVEILSESNTEEEMRLKRADYFRSGCRLVWEIDPETRTVTVYTRVDPPEVVLTEADTLTGDPVLPGFTVSLAMLFGELDRHG